MPQPKPPQQSLWVTKKQACKFLGVGERQIERRMDAGQVRHKRMPREPHQPVALTVLHVDDLRAIKEGKPNRYPSLIRSAQIPPDLKQITQGPAAENREGNSMEIAQINPAGIENLSRPEQIDATLKPEGRPPLARPIKRLWQTAVEVEEWLGLPAAFLIRAARRGELVAINTSTTREKQDWRFHRASLSRWLPPAAPQSEQPPALSDPESGSEGLIAQTTGARRERSSGSGREPASRRS